MSYLYAFNDPKLDQNRLREVGTEILLESALHRKSRKAKVVNLNTAHALENGDNVRVEIEGVFRAYDLHRGWEPAKGGRVISSVDGITELGTFSRYATVLVLSETPKWVPGDVIDLWFSFTDKNVGNSPYTYVRGATDWPGDSKSALSDSRVDDLWSRDLVTIVRKKKATQ